MRYLYTADGDDLVAYAPGRRDYFRSSDDTLWAHESHNWLIAAKSGEVLAHRTGDVYYDVAGGEALYRVTVDRIARTEHTSEPRSADSLRLRREIRRPLKAQR